MKYYCIHLDAGHDRNGNPRRAYLIFDANGNTLACLDEGYKGIGVIPDNIYKNMIILAHIKTTPKEYRDYLKCTIDRLP